MTKVIVEGIWIMAYGHGETTWKPVVIEKPNSKASMSDGYNSMKGSRHDFGLSLGWGDEPTPKATPKAAPKATPKASKIT
jgi:hypothetical protein